MPHTNLNGGFWIIKIWIKKEPYASNFIEDLLEIICVLERGEKLHLYKIMQRGIILFFITNFPALNGEMTRIENSYS